MEKEWLSVPELAQYWGIGRSRAYEIVKAGMIRSKKLSPRRTRIHIDDARNFMNGKGRDIS